MKAVIFQGKVFVKVEDEPYHVLYSKKVELRRFASIVLAKELVKWLKKNVKNIEVTEANITDLQDDIYSTFSDSKPTLENGLANLMDNSAKAKQDK